MACSAVTGNAGRSSVKNGVTGDRLEPFPYLIHHSCSIGMLGHLNFKGGVLYASESCFYTLRFVFRRCSLESVGIQDFREDLIFYIDTIKIQYMIIYIIWLVVWNMTFMTFHILGIIIPTDFHVFQRGWNHQTVIYRYIHYTHVVICSMYGMFTYIWVTKMMWMLANIPYMEQWGYKITSLYNNQNTIDI